MFSYLKSLFGPLYDWFGNDDEQPTTQVPPSDATQVPPAPTWLNEVREERDKDWDERMPSPCEKPEKPQFKSFLDEGAPEPVQFFCKLLGEETNRQFFYWVEEKALGFESNVHSAERNPDGKEFKHTETPKFVIIRENVDIDDLKLIWDGTKLHRGYYDAAHRGEMAQFLETLVEKRSQEQMKYRFIDTAPILTFDAIRENYDIRE